ncbi:uncharacterized protein [Eurosta solidaginis]
MVEKIELILVQHNGRKKFNGTFEFKVELQFLEVEGSLKIKRSTKDWVPFANLKVDMCKFLMNDFKSNRYLRLFLKDLKQSTLATAQCPLPAAPLSYTSAKTKIFDHSMVEKIELILVQHNGRKKFNGTFEYKVELQFLEVEGSLKFKRSTKDWVPFANLKVDMCKFLGNNFKSNRYLRLFLKDLKQSTLGTAQCPFPAHTTYKLEQFDVSWEPPQSLPNVTFAVQVKGYTKGHLLWEIVVNGFTKNFLKIK